MPWDPTIARADRSPLGEIGSVRQAVEAAFRRGPRRARRCR